mgnify:CR=1 FL=1
MWLDTARTRGGKRARVNEQWGVSILSIWIEAARSEDGSDARSWRALKGFEPTLSAYSRMQVQREGNLANMNDECHIFPRLCLYDRRFRLGFHPTLIELQ